MVQWIGRRREQGASCGCTPASCSPRLASFGEGEESFRLFCVTRVLQAPRDRTAPHRTGGQEVAVPTVHALLKNPGGDVVSAFGVLAGARARVAELARPPAA